MWRLRQGVVEPYQPGSGYDGPPLVELHVADQGLETRPTVRLTTGDARVLAAHLIATADRVDLS